MADLVILKSPLMCAALSLIIILHILAAIVSTLSREKLFASPNLISAIIEGVGILIHLAVLFYGLAFGASLEEILLTVLLSGAVGITAIGIADKKSKNDTGKE